MGRAEAGDEGVDSFSGNESPSTDPDAAELTARYQLPKLGVTDAAEHGSGRGLVEQAWPVRDDDGRQGARFFHSGASFLVGPAGPIWPADQHLAARL